MKQGIPVVRIPRSPSRPFERRYAEACKELLRVRTDCKSIVASTRRKVRAEISEARANLERALALAGFVQSRPGLWARLWWALRGGAPR